MNMKILNKDNFNMDHWLKGIVLLYRITDDITTQNIVNLDWILLYDFPEFCNILLIFMIMQIR